MHQLSRTRTWLVGLLSACLALAGLSLSPLQAAAEPTPTPIGQWLATDIGNIRITSVSPVKAEYNVGDVVSFKFRMESNGSAPKRDMEVSSTTLSNPSSCDWATFPGGLGGKYDCPRTGTPAITYTITQADADAGQALVDLTWTHYPLDADNNRVGDPIVTTIYGALPVTQAEPEPVDILDVSIARTDSLGEEVRVGDVVTYSVTYTNKSDAAFTAFPRTSNLDGVIPPTVPNCRWAGLAAGATATCTTASHTITQADLDAGSFTGTVTFDATSDREGAVVLQAGVTATAAPITVTDAPAPPREEGQYITLASANYAGFTCHRIPALTQANNGWILASWDGRPGGCGDAPNPNSIVQRISKDGGQTWEEATVIAQGQVAAPKYGYSDPSYVVDRETGTIFNFFVKSFDQGFWGSVAGTDPENRNVIHAAYIKSEDNGATWSEPVVITDDITSDPAWRSRFAASGEGIQLRYGEYAGRLIQQYSVNNDGVVQAVSVYSDDHGATWQAGTPVGTVMDENKTVELSDGRVMLNSRAPGTGARKIAISEDGGETYGEVYIDYALIDPTNNASITRAYPNAPAGSAQAKMLLFSNAANTGSRSNGTIRLSYDDGQTWSVAKVFEPGSMSYSTLTPLAYGPDAQPGVYGLLFEGTTSTIRYMQVSLDWLGGLPVAVTAEAQTVNRGENTVTYTVTNVSDEDLTGLVVTPAAPTGWTATPSAAFDLAAGEVKDVTVQVTAPEWADAGSLDLAVSVGNDDGASQGTAQLTLELLPGQNPAEDVPVEVVGTLPAQSGQGQANMFDGDVATLWHTPWAQDMDLPLDIDLTVGDTPLELANLSMTPRQTGVNGRITQYEIYAGDSLEELTKIGEGTLANSASTKLIPLDTTARFVRFRVLEAATDSGTQFVSIAELAIKAAVADDPIVAPMLSPIDDATIELGSAVSMTVSATGDDVAYSADGLPAGVALDAETGAITGTPTAVSSGTVTVTATNDGGSDSETFTLTVRDTTAPVVTALGNVSVQVGSAVSVQVAATDLAELSYSATGLPAGVEIDAETGLISGTPTAAGTSSVTVRVADASGNETERAFTLTVTAAPVVDETGPVISPITAASGMVGASVNIAVQATDESTPLTYSATGLPAGVQINASTGVISGSPEAAGTFPVQVKVTDAKGNSTTASFTMTVAPATDPVPEFPRKAPYTLPGEHHINGRDWRTVCERYSQTERCRTEIWASVVKRTGKTFTIDRGWAFNNLTYLPFMKREQWANNPLGHTATWIGTDGAQWRTECDTELSGPNACRSFRWTTVYTATKGDDGRYEFGQENKWVFNNIVMFGSYGR